jgi:carbon storage regulator CsrA
MLVLSRKRDEGVTLDIQLGPYTTRVHVLICDVNGSRVKVGVDAAACVDIQRDEFVTDQDFDIAEVSNYD